MQFKSSVLSEFGDRPRLCSSLIPQISLRSKVTDTFPPFRPVHTEPTQFSRCLTHLCHTMHFCAINSTLVVCLLSPVRVSGASCPTCLRRGYVALRLFSIKEKREINNVFLCYLDDLSCVILIIVLVLS